MVAKSTSWLSMCACLCACAMGANAADYPSWLADFVEPKDSRYAMQPIIHDWPQDIDGMVEALKAYGCRGAVLNCPFANGFTTNPDNIATLSKIMDAMDAAGLKYWIYDEPGYPSGMAGGLTLKDHPEFEAKGFYMRRDPTYDEPKTVHFRLDDQSDKIVWSTVLFDHRHEVIHNRVPIQQVEPLTENQYYVRGTTALLDAVGRAIHHIGTVHRYARDEDIPEKTLFIITTDGMENASRQYTYDNVKRMIERQKEKYGWEFIFLGANIDAAREAERFGIHKCRAVRYENDRRGTQINYSVMSNVVSRARAAESVDEMSMAFDEEALLEPAQAYYEENNR